MLIGRHFFFQVKCIWMWLFLRICWLVTGLVWWRGGAYKGGLFQEGALLFCCAASKVLHWRFLPCHAVILFPIDACFIRVCLKKDQKKRTLTFVWTVVRSSDNLWSCFLINTQKSTHHHRKAAVKRTKMSVLFLLPYRIAPFTNTHISQVCFWQKLC